MAGVITNGNVVENTSRRRAPAPIFTLRCPETIIPPAPSPIFTVRIPIRYHHLLRLLHNRLRVCAILTTPELKLSWDN